MYFLSIYEPDIYTCIAQSIKLSSSDDRTITRVTGTHLEGKTDSDVDDFTSIQIVTLFPENLQDTFKKASRICIVYAGIKTITKDDLKQFGKQLTHLLLQGNRLEVIDADLFNYNTKLKLVELSDSQIKVVGKGVFHDLRFLSDLNFWNNPCFNGDAHRPRKLKKLIDDIEEHCKSSIVSVEVDKEVREEFSW
mgnify:FL=1